MVGCLSINPAHHAVRQTVHLRRIGAILLIGIGVVCPEHQAQTVAEGDEAAGAIRGLFSSVHAEREAAKERLLLGVGTPTVPQLLQLLRDLPVLEDARDDFDRPSPDGSTENVEKLIKKYFGRRVGVQVKLGLSTVLSAEIAWRLREDIFDLLGLIGDEQAVPLLIQIMENRETYTRLANFSGEMRALARVGSPAVPRLIEAIETAEDRASSLPYVMSEPEEELRRGLVAERVAQVRARAARVLGEIGDLRALPVLERLLQPEARSHSTGAERDYVVEAIQRLLAHKNSGIVRN